MYIYMCVLFHTVLLLYTEFTFMLNLFDINIKHLILVLSFDLILVIFSPFNIYDYEFVWIICLNLFGQFKFFVCFLLRLTACVL